jgi:hypothetical protein
MHRSERKASATGAVVTQIDRLPDAVEVDKTLVGWFLSLTPTERVEWNQKTIPLVRELRDAFEAHR